MNLPYQNSDDYQHLATLIENGVSVICVVDFNYGKSDEPAFICGFARFSKSTIMEDWHVYQVIGISNLTAFNRDDFINNCRDVKLRYVYPNLAE